VYRVRTQEQVVKRARETYNATTGVATIIGSIHYREATIKWNALPLSVVVAFCRPYSRRDQIALSGKNCGGVEGIIRYGYGSFTSNERGRKSATTISWISRGIAKVIEKARKARDARSCTITRDVLTWWSPQWHKAHTGITGRAWRMCDTRRGASRVAEEVGAAGVASARARRGKRRRLTVTDVGAIAVVVLSSTSAVIPIIAIVEGAIC